MTESNGYIKLYRKLKSWGWYQNYVVKDLFIHLLISANFKETKWQGEILKPGQLITSYKNLAKELDFSVHQIRNALDKLKSTGEITSKSTNKFTIITLVNWEDYQGDNEKTASKKTSKTANEGHSKGKQRANKGQQIKNDNNLIMINNDKNIDPRLAADLAAAGITYEEYLRIKNQ